MLYIQEIQQLNLKIKTLEEVSKSDEEKHKTVVEGFQSQIQDLQKLVESARHVRFLYFTLHDAPLCFIQTKLQSNLS